MPDPNTLPSYEQIKNWLGPGWIATQGEEGGEVPDEWLNTHWPSPWVFCLDRNFRCFLSHDDGTRVQVCVPDSGPLNWASWFTRISARIEGDISNYGKHVTWHRGKSGPRPALAPNELNPLDLKPGERVEVLEFHQSDGERFSMKEGHGTVMICGSNSVSVRLDNGSTGTCLVAYNDKWRRIPAESKPDSSQPQEAVPLGDLTPGEWFEFVRTTQSYLNMPIRLTNVHGGYETAKGYRSGSDLSVLVRRVDNPNSPAGSGDTATGNAAVTASSDSATHDSPQPAGSTSDRWKGANPDDIPELERRLAEQLASGGIDCKAQRSLMVGAMRVAREERERGAHVQRRGASYSRILDSQQPSTLALRSLPKPLIAYKRSR